MQAESADGDIERRQHAEHVDLVKGQIDLFVRLAKRRVFHRLTGLHAAARERHLASVPSKRPGADGQQHMGSVVNREEQQEAPGVPDGVADGRPLAPRPGGKRRLSCRAGKRLSQSQRKRLQEAVEVHTGEQVVGIDGAIRRIGDRGSNPENENGQYGMMERASLE
jgi:hypothetical protein